MTRPAETSTSLTCIPFASTAPTRCTPIRNSYIPRTSAAIAGGSCSLMTSMIAQRIAPWAPSRRIRLRAASRAQEDDGSMPASHRPGLRVNSGLTIPESELSWRFSRSSGPGGQGVNTADSRVELVWDVAGSAVLSPLQRERLLERLSSRVVDGVLTITASEHRAQLRNRNAARARLAAVVAHALRPPSPSRRPTSPGRGAKERRLEAKKRRTDVKRLRRPPHD